MKNKIYAVEQENQLIRYSNIYKNQPILFLTLNGKASNQCGMLNINEHYFCISYQDTITNWLEECINITGISVMVREVLRQYLYLIQNLTNQSTNVEMNQEIIEILKNNIPASFEIFGKEKALKESIIKEFFENLVALTQGSSLNFCEGNFNYSLSESEVYFSNDSWKKRGLYLVFGFEIAGFRDFYAGLYLETPDTSLTSRFKEFKTYEINGHYAFAYLADGNTVEDWISFENGEIERKCQEILEEVIGFVEQTIN